MLALGSIGTIARGNSPIAVHRAVHEINERRQYGTVHSVLNHLTPTSALADEALIRFKHPEA